MSSDAVQNDQQVQGQPGNVRVGETSMMDRTSNDRSSRDRRSSRQQGNALVQAIWALAGVAVIIAAIFYMRTVTPSSVSFTTPYQAVLLTNGSAYFGKLEGYGTPRPVLTEVYYIVTQTNPETKQTNNVLVKRGQELHKPDRMYLNPNQILCVEPVGTDSKVAQLIAQAH
jgi:hypothetical protein